MPATLSILTNVFRDPRERGRAIAVWAGFSGLAVAIGPVTGGLLLRHFEWSSVFWVNLPLVALALVAGWFLVPTSKDPSHSHLDPLGAVLSIVGLGALLFGIIEGPAKGWTDPLVLGSFAVGAVAMASFIVWELHTPTPMLDMRFFRNPRFTAANSAITLTFFAMFGSMFLMTQYWQFVHGYSPLGAGLRMIPYALTMMVVAPMSARIVERVGTKRVVTAGLLDRLRRPARPLVPPDGHALPVGDQRVLRDGRRHGHDDGARHRVRHGLAAAGEGGRRLGRQRHDPAGRRRPRRRRDRQRRVEHLRQQRDERRGQLRRHRQ